MKEASGGRQKFTVIPRAEAARLGQGNQIQHPSSDLPIASQDNIITSNPINSLAASSHGKVVLFSTTSSETLCAEMGREHYNFRGVEIKAAIPTETVVAILREGDSSFRWDHVSIESVGSILRRLADEREIPASMLGRHDLIAPAEFLGGRNLSGLYAYARKHLESDTQDVSAAILEIAGIRMSIDDVVRYMSSGGRVRWEKVPSDVLRELLQKVGEEVNAPSSMLMAADLNRPLDFLNGNRLAGLYVHATGRSEREQQDPIEFLLNRAGVQRTTEDIIAALQSNKRIMWDRVTQENIGDLLRRAADELGKPASMLRVDDLSRPFTFLQGRSLDPLYHYYSNQTQQEGTGMTFPSLLESAGIHIGFDDVVQQITSGQLIVWDRVPNDVVRQLLETAAAELGVPASVLGSWDFFRPLDFLGGKTLSKLYSHSRSYVRRENDAVSALMDRAEISITAEDVIQRIAQHRRVRWERIPQAEITKLLHRFSAETGVPLASLQQPDFNLKLPVLNNRSLIGLYGYFFQHPDRQGRDTIAFMFEQAGIQITADDVIAQIRSGRPVVWGRVPREETRVLIEGLAHELGVPASMLADDDFTRTPLELLDEHTFAGLYNNTRNDPSRNDKPTTEFLVGAAGLTVTAEDVINTISISRTFRWGRVPWEAMNTIVRQAASEMKLPLNMLKAPDLMVHFDFLNQRTLGGWYAYCVRHPEKSVYETTMAFIRRRLGLPDPAPSLTRANYRMQQMQESFGRQVLAGQIEELTMDGLMPWIHSVARLYQNPLLDMSREDMESELAILISEELQGENLGSTTSFVRNLHGRLEKFIREASRRQYKEKSLSSPIAESLTLGDLLGTIDRGLEEIEQEGEEMSIEIQESLARLSPLQRQLIHGIAVEERTFEEMGTELGMDADTLQEHYDDALTLLRGTTETEIE